MLHVAQHGLRAGLAQHTWQGVDGVSPQDACSVWWCWLVVLADQHVLLRSAGWNTAQGWQHSHIVSPAYTCYFAHGHQDGLVLQQRGTVQFGVLHSCAVQRLWGRTASTPLNI
jgi:hypothetical protein